MWVAELKVWHEGGMQIELSKELDVVVASYYLNVFKDRGREAVAKVFTVIGRDKHEFIERFSKDKRAMHFHAEGDLLYCVISPNKIFHNAVLEKSVFFLKPIITKKGFEYWTVASWDKQSIRRLVKRIRESRRFAHAELLSLSQQKLNFFIPSIFAELTGKQREAIELAYENGYYTYPRKISVEQLAGLAKVPRATLQEHLRKAEAKVLPALMTQLSFRTPEDGKKQ